MNFFLLFTGQNIHKHLSFSNGLLKHKRKSQNQPAHDRSELCQARLLGSTLS